MSQRKTKENQRKTKEMAMVAPPEVIQRSCPGGQQSGGLAALALGSAGASSPWPAELRPSDDSLSKQAW